MNEGKADMHFGEALYICGTRGSSPRTGAAFSEFGGDTTCFALRFGSHGIIVDCGTGFSKAAQLLSDCNEINILLTHFHYDHLLGLLGCASTAFPEKPILLYAHGDGFDPKVALDTFGKPPFWPAPFYLESVNVRPLDAPGRFEAGGFQIVWREGNHPGGVAHYLVESPDGKRVCFMFDHEPVDIAADVQFAKNADILVYDGMFTDEEYKQHVGWGHSTIENGIKTAALAHTKKLIVTHHISCRTDDELRALEKKYTVVAPNLLFARENGVVRL